MSFFRSHIIKFKVLFLVATGILFISWPGENAIHAGESVSNWLLEFRSDTENPDVHHKINALRTENGNIPKVLRKASFIVSEHHDDFTLPVDTGNSSDDDIYNTLLLKWSVHQQNTHTETLVFTDRQSQVSQTSDKEYKTIWNQLEYSVQFVVGAYSRISEALDYIYMILRPLVSGIAINAP